MSFMPFLRTAGGYLLKTVGPYLLGKGAEWLGNKVSGLFDRGHKALQQNRVVGPTYSKWNGYDDFRANLMKTGRMVADSVVPKNINVDQGMNVGDALRTGFKQGLDIVMGRNLMDPNLQNNVQREAGGNDIIMT